MATDDDGDDTPSPYIRFRIEPEQKRKWLEHLEESQHSTLTDLIKTSVTNTMSNTWVLANDTQDDPIPEGLGDSIDQIDDRLQAIETQIDDASLNAAAPGAADDDGMSKEELMQLASHCHDNILIVQSAGHLPDLNAVYEAQKLPPRDQAKLAGTAQEISAYLDEPVDDVRNALIYLERQRTTNIESQIQDGTRRWFEIDPTVEHGIPSRLELEEAVKESPEFEGSLEEFLKFAPGSEFDE